MRSIYLKHWNIVQNGNKTVPDTSYSFRFLFWKAVAIISLVLAGFGLLLPVLPTVPFIILAAWAGGKGWPRLEIWLLEHPRYGPLIHRWRDYRAVPRRAKILAIALMSISGLLLALGPLAVWIKAVVTFVMVVIAIWLWRHPDY